MCFSPRGLHSPIVICLSLANLPVSVAPYGRYVPSNPRMPKHRGERFMRRLSIILFLMVFVAGMTACHSKPDDQTITKDIQGKVAADPVAQDSHVTVESHDGEVKLTGSAKDEA